jgi:phage terminase large subunit
VELQRRGFGNVIEAENEVIDGIRFHGLQLSNGTFKICGGCDNAIKEYGTYRWDVKASQRGEDKPIKSNDHLMDAIRYVLYTQWFMSMGNGLSAEDVDKMRREAYGGGDTHGRFFDDKLWG